VYRSGVNGVQKWSKQCTEVVCIDINLTLNTIYREQIITQAKYVIIDR